jgi:hypothetical protein
MLLPSWFLSNPPFNTVGDGRLLVDFAHRAVKPPIGNGRLSRFPDLAPPNVPRGTLGSPESPSRAVTV